MSSPDEDRPAAWKLFPLSDRAEHVPSASRRLPRIPAGWLSWRPAVLSGTRNRISYPGALPPVAALTTFTFGSSRDNEVSFGAGLRGAGLRILISGNGNRVEIGRDVTISGLIRVCGNGLTVRIGDRSDIKAGRIVAWFGSVEIGADCLFAGRVLVRTSDVHPVFDRASGLRLNPPGDVRVGDRVWVALEAALLKGAVVPSDCVVGMRALVTKPFSETGCVIAGVPARVIRHGVTWARHHDDRVPAAAEEGLPSSSGWGQGPTAV